MLKLCGKPVCKPLDLIFQSCMRQGKFPTEWKKANVVPLHEKRYKQILKDYRPVSSLPICEKIFERLIYNNIFEYFIENDFISQTNLVLSQTLMYKSTNIYYSWNISVFEVRRVFLDIPKAFDKVWHESLIYKLKQNGIKGNLLDTLTNSLNDRKQRVVLNGQHSKWANIEAGVPLPPLRFLIYINDLPVNLISVV